MTDDEALALDVKIHERLDSLLGYKLSDIDFVDTKDLIFDLIAEEIEPYRLREEKLLADIGSLTSMRKIAESFHNLAVKERDFARMQLEQALADREVCSLNAMRRET